MGRDWHATYLTDARAMAAARERAMRTGDDGWAAAYTLALTLPPASGSHDAVGARDILVPQTLPDTGELARLAHATPEDPDADHSGGYYDEPNITVGNLDLAPSMTRRAKPGEVVRPDLRCPACCASAGVPEEAGMPRQTYRCTDCGELWNYVPGVDGGEDACGHCWACLLQQHINLVEDQAEQDARAVTIFDFLRGVSVVRMGPSGPVQVSPLPASSRPSAASEPPWRWPATAPEEAPESPLVWGAWVDEAARDAHPAGVSYGTDGRSVRWFVDEFPELADPMRDQRRETARMVAEAFGLPEHLVRGETDEEYWERVEVEAGQLLTLLHDVSRGRVTTRRVDEYPAAPEARQRRLLTTGGPERGFMRARIGNRRMQLTALGRIVHRALRDISPTRGRDRHVL